MCNLIRVFLKNYPNEPFSFSFPRMGLKTYASVFIKSICFIRKCKIIGVFLFLNWLGYPKLRNNYVLLIIIKKNWNVLLANYNKIRIRIKNLWKWNLGCNIMALRTWRRLFIIIVPSPTFAWRILKNELRFNRSSWLSRFVRTVNSCGR